MAETLEGHVNSGLLFLGSMNPAPGWPTPSICQGLRHGIYRMFRRDSSELLFDRLGERFPERPIEGVGQPGAGFIEPRKSRHLSCLNSRHQHQHSSLSISIQHQQLA